MPPQTSPIFHIWHVVFCFFIKEGMFCVGRGAKCDDEKRAETGNVLFSTGPCGFRSCTWKSNPGNVFGWTAFINQCNTDYICNTHVKCNVNNGLFLGYPLQKWNILKTIWNINEIYSININDTYSNLDFFFTNTLKWEYICKHIFWKKSTYL